MSVCCKYATSLHSSCSSSNSLDLKSIGGWVVSGSNMPEKGCLYRARERESAGQFGLFGRCIGFPSFTYYTPSRSKIRGLRQGPDGRMGGRVAECRLGIIKFLRFYSRGTHFWADFTDKHCMQRRYTGSGFWSERSAVGTDDPIKLIRSLLVKKE